jgi:hypothetical protein
MVKEKSPEEFLNGDIAEGHLSSTMSKGTPSGNPQLTTAILTSPISLSVSISITVATIIIWITTSDRPGPGGHPTVGEECFRAP